MSWDWDLITRHTYIGITPLWKAVFYGIILSSLGVGVVWYWKRLQLWRQGQPDGEPLPIRTRIQNMLGYALAQKKVPSGRKSARTSSSKRASGSTRGCITSCTRSRWTCSGWA